MFSVIVVLGVPVKDVILPLTIVTFKAEIVPLAVGIAVGYLVGYLDGAAVAVCLCMVSSVRERERAVSL